MRLARELDERMLKLQRQGRLGTFPPNTGHEAVSVPIAMAMGPQDWFVGAFRETGGRLVRGEPLTSPLYYYNGWEEGNILPDPALRITAGQRGDRLPDPARGGPGLRQPLPGRGRGRRLLHRRRRHQRGRLPRGPELRRGLEGAGRVHRAEQPVGHLHPPRRARPPAARWPRRAWPSTCPACRSTATTRWRCTVAITRSAGARPVGQGPVRSSRRSPTA